MEITRASSKAWPWPEALDALVAAPDYHKLLFENEHVRVLDVRIGPGQIVPVHTHKWPSVIQVRSASDFVRRDGDGNLLFDSRDAGAADEAPAIIWTDSLPPHSVENIGNAEIHLVSVEIKPLTA
jgi:predicted metal-dependent enzyme (double-stranded beta helix superfamily)